ncbi:MAG: hypothetical protein DWQ37_22760 [Planctomycetota bacterium]|nr:MAG: hypothetical protein DWQ37_22760 [Planctomycetota bacterium]
MLAAALVGTAHAQSTTPRVVRQAFDVDPGWESFRNRLAPEKPHQVKQDFGYRSSNFAGGQQAGEIGGRVQRSAAAAFYGLKIEPKSLDDRLSASGKLAVASAEGASGAMVGWFHAPPPSWRTPNSVAFRLDGNGGKFWMFYEYGTRNWHTGGGGAFEGDRYQTTVTPPFPADGRVHTWKLDYDPEALDGRGLLTFVVDDRHYEVPLEKGHREDGAILDHFGIWNVQTPGSELELYLDDLVVDGQRYAFDDDPQWDAEDNHAEYRERFVRPYHDYGYSPTAHAGGTPGEIGGVVFRDEQPTYYAAETARLSLDDELIASGKLALLKGASDSGVYFGWFDSATKRGNQTPEHEQRQKNYLAAFVEGPSRVGHYFRPGYACSDGSGRNASETSDAGRHWPIVSPDGAQHTWALHYRPQAADGNGQIEITFDGQTDTFDLQPGDRAKGAAFDRFGIFNMQSGGHAVEIYLDDVSFSAQ